MYDDISPKLERKIVGSFLLVALLFGALSISRGQSVHVESVVREKQNDGSVEYVVEIVNPTERYVKATVCLVTGTGANDGAIPAGVARHKKGFSINSSSTRIVEFSFENGKMLGPLCSASICDVE